LAYVVTGGFTGAFGVSVISTATNEVIASIDTGQFFGFGVGVTPDGTRAYVAGVAPRGGGQALAISTATNEIVATVDLGPQGTNGRFVKISPDGAFAYVMSESGTGAVYVISTATNTVVDVIEIGTVASNPDVFEMSPDGEFLFVLDNTFRDILVLISTSDRQVTLVETGTHREATLAVTPDSSSVYVPVGIALEQIVVISTATASIVDTIDSDQFDGINLMIASPDGAFVYVLSYDGTAGRLGVVSVISTASNTVVASVPGDVDLRGLGFADVNIRPDGAFIYASDANLNRVHVISTENNTVVDSLAVGIGEKHMALTSDGELLYVTNADTNSVSVISTETNTVVATVMPVGDRPGHLAITP
jgi:YVTN family beta-propeller protein